MTCGVAGCGREIVRGPLGQWAHTTNPGRDHHYPRPATRPGESDLAGAGTPRVAETPSRRTGSPVAVPPSKAAAAG